MNSQRRAHRVSHISERLVLYHVSGPLGMPWCQLVCSLTFLYIYIDINYIVNKSAASQHAIINMYLGLLAWAQSNLSFSKNLAAQPLP